MYIKEFSNTKLREIEENLIQLNKRVAKLQKDLFNSKFIDNSDFIRLMQISSSTAKNWRNKGIIPYSQIENKFYYQITDIQNVLYQHYKSFTNQKNNK